MWPWVLGSSKLTSEFDKSPPKLILKQQILEKQPDPKSQKEENPKERLKENREKLKMETLGQVGGVL